MRVCTCSKENNDQISHCDQTLSEAHSVATMKLLAAILLCLAYFGTLCTALEPPISESKSPLERVNELAVEEDCVEKQLEMCQRRETDLANTVVTSLRRESDVKTQLQSCEDREKLLNFKLQQHQEANVNQIKEVSRNLSDCQVENQQCKTQEWRMEAENHKMQESLKQCTQSVQQLTMGQETIIRLLGESREELKHQIMAPKASLPLVNLETGTYLFMNKLMNWNDARKFCKSNGMDLVSIETEDENTKIYNHAKTLPGNSRWYQAWTSGCYSASRGAHVWESTGQTVNYFKWASQEPSRRADGYCIQVANHSPNWWDESINSTVRVVCEL